MYRMTTVVSGQDTDVNKSRLHSWTNFNSNNFSYINCFISTLPLNNAVLFSFQLRAYSIAKAQVILIKLNQFNLFLFDLN